MSSIVDTRDYRDMDPAALIDHWHEGGWYPEFALDGSIAWKGQKPGRDHIEAVDRPEVHAELRNRRLQYVRSRLHSWRTAAGRIELVDGVVWLDKLSLLVDQNGIWKDIRAHLDELAVLLEPTANRAFMPQPWAGQLARWRVAVMKAIEAPSSSARKLLEVTDSLYLESGWGTKFHEHGWDELSLFGIENDSEPRPALGAECLGAVCRLVLPQHSSWRIEQVTDEQIVTNWLGRGRFSIKRDTIKDAVVWWEHPYFTGKVQDGPPDGVVLSAKAAKAAAPRAPAKRGK